MERSECLRGSWGATGEGDSKEIDGNVRAPS